MPRLWRYLTTRLVIAGGLLGTGCAPVAVLESLPPAAPLLGPAAPQQVGPDAVTLLRSGTATFVQLQQLIDDARMSVHVEVYEFNHPLLVDAVLQAHARGVDVTVIDDPSEVSSAATAQRLRGAGVTVIDYPVRKLMIDHVKLLVVDGSVAVVGGINWGSASPANHDYDAMIRGPSVHNLDRVFDRDLVTCGVPAAIPAPLLDAGITVASTLPGAEIRPLALQLIDGAMHSLRLELFVLTDTAIVHALEAARQRGVDVRLLLDPSQHSSDPSYQSLVSSGVPVRWYRTRGELLHAKAIVADANGVLFGSANWSGGGFDRNHELDIEMAGEPVIASQMQAQMALDWAASA
ncbi:MAG: phosphatidylserine/phosphatidylglycerophosphate/cardiolipin synthase family protein [Candidatus Dormibacteraeota bacterium]|nr:phosphatidylserine/phosphatidylglycerophosphate/cardiolipin synthase family protein [Candidatus Dormibacteraeota bacterium]